MNKTNSNQLAQIVGKVLLDNHLCLLTAESCTGGLIGHLITNISGSSEYFLGGVLAYSNQTKVNLLGVKQQTLDSSGAVSRETALEMALGVRSLFSDQFPPERLISLSVTGIAGPGGGMPQKPVGLVWIGLSWLGGTYAWQHQWLGDREQNKLNSAQAALEHLIETVSPLSV